jgi:hypothetical protein
LLEGACLGGGRELSPSSNICKTRSHAHDVRAMQVFSLTAPTEDGDELLVDLFVQHGDLPADPAFL